MKKNFKRKKTRFLGIVLPVLALLMSSCILVDNSRDYGHRPLPTSVTELKIMTYNIRMGAGTDDPDMSVYRLPWGKNLSGVIAAIKAEDADIVALQEVAGSGQAKELAKALNMNSAYEHHNTETGNAPWWGVAILSKFPILAVKGAQISPAISSKRGGRSIVLATVDVLGTPLTLVCIHKDHRLTSGSSLSNIRDAVADASGPVVLAGDFNVQPWDTRLDVLRPRFVDTARVVNTEGARQAISKGTGKWFGRIDYVFSEVASLKVIDVGLSPHRRESDHYAYWARLSLNRGDDDWDVEAPLKLFADGSLKPPEGAVRMNGDEIVAATVGNSWIYPNNDGGTYFDPDGNTAINWKGNRDTGQWYVEEDEICLYEDSLGAEWCYKFYRLNGGIVTYDEQYSKYINVLFEVGNRF